MSLSTATTKTVTAVNAALFWCPVCEGHHLANGSKASPYQQHRPRGDGSVCCDGCGRRRPLLVEGEAIPVSVRRWPGLPRGFKIPPGVLTGA